MNSFTKILISLCSIAVGTLIYLLFRGGNIRLFDWVNNLNLESVLISFRLNFSEINPPDWFVYNLPGILYSFAFFVLLSAIWDRATFQYYFWGISFVVLVLSSEVLQKYHVIKGTYDFGDIAAYFAGIFLSIPFIKFKKYSYDKI